MAARIYNSIFQNSGQKNVSVAGQNNHAGHSVMGAIQAFLQQNKRLFSRDLAKGMRKPMTMLWNG